LIVAAFAHVHFHHAFQRLEEGLTASAQLNASTAVCTCPPELMTTVFTVRDAVDATLLFKLDHLLDSLLLDWHELVRRRGFVGDGIAFLHELIWPEKGPNVLYETDQYGISRRVAIESVPARKGGLWGAEDMLDGQRFFND